MKPTFRLFLDESGDHSYGKVVKKPFKLLMKGKVLWETMFPSYPSLEEEGKRYLGLTGSIFDLNYYHNNLNKKFNEFKQNFFHTDDIVFHAKDIKQRKGIFNVLQNEELANKFDAGLLDLIQSSEYILINVVLDKKSHVERYHKPWHPYQYSLLALLQRYCYFLSDKSAPGDIVAECRGAKENNALQEAYQKIYKTGDGMYKKGGFYQQYLTSNKIKIKKKKQNINGLQFSDILAGPLKKYNLIKHKIIKEPEGELFGKKIMEAAKGKIRSRTWDKKIKGYGIILIK